MLLKDVKNLTRTSKCKYGKFKILNKIYRKVYTVLFTKLNLDIPKIPRILKKVGDNEFSLVCRYVKNAKISKNKKSGGCKGVEFNKIADILYEDQLEPKDYKKYTQFYWFTQPKTESCVEIVKMTPFLNEVSQNEILKKFSSHYEYYCGFDTAWKSKRQGNICMEYSGKPLANFAEHFGEDDIKCIIFQVLLALAWGQYDVHMKHHDLHTENVFIQSIKPEDKTEFTTVSFPVVDKETTHPLGLNKKRKIQLVEYDIPKRFTIKLADFGLSSSTNPKTKRRHERADFPLMESEGSKKWGKFDGTLYGNESYDVLCFLYGLMDDANSIGRTYIKQVLAKINDLAGRKVKVSRYNRPMETCNVNPYEILTSNLFDSWKKI